MFRLILIALSVSVGAIAQTPCTILTPSDIKSVVGAEPAAGKPNPNNARVCHFALKPEPNGVTVSLDQVNSMNGADKVMEAYAKQKMELQVVAGLGDKAFFLKAFGMNTLSVYKGQKVITVIVLQGGAPEAKLKDLEQKLARIALGRI